MVRGCQSSASVFDLIFRTWRPLYIPVLRSTWCGRRSSPESLSSMYVGLRKASAERRMPRLDGDTLRFGTAMGCVLPGIGAQAAKARHVRQNREGALIEDRPVER